MLEYLGHHLISYISDHSLINFKVNNSFICEKCNNIIFYYNYDLDTCKLYENNFYWMNDDAKNPSWHEIALTCEEEQIKRLLE